ncbi:MAG TPA: BON domain-containing protein [Gemmatimonadales bacterium]
MAYLRYRDDTPSRGALYLTVGAVAGLAAGILIAHRFGGLAGLSGLSAQMRRRLRRATEQEELEGDDYYDEVGYAGYGAEVYDEFDDELTPEEELEERVLEAFRNDPILSERAVDIGALGEGIIELTGWVHEQDELTHARTITRGVPGVETVVNRLVVREEDDDLEDAALRYESEGSSMAGKWEGQQVGTGRRRQGTSADADRHADPKPVLEEKWLREEEAVREAAGDLEGLAERRQRSAADEPRDRTGGAPVSPSGVPKSDHVQDADQNRPEIPGRPDLRPRAD